MTTPTIEKMYEEREVLRQKLRRQHHMTMNPHILGIGIFTYFQPSKYDRTYPESEPAQKNREGFRAARWERRIFKAATYYECTATEHKFNSRLLVRLFRFRDRLMGISAAIRWLQEFELTCQNCGPTGVTHGLMCMMVRPELDDEWVDLNAWIAVDHNLQRYNQAVWEIMKAHGLVQKVRRVVRTDLTHDSDLEGFGRTIRKDYGSKLLVHFLRARPSKKWVESAAA